MGKKALLVTRVSGFVPQHEMNNVRILQEMGYEVHYATNLRVVVYGNDNRRLEGTGIVTHQIDFERTLSPGNARTAYRQLRELLLTEEFDLIHCHMPVSGVVARLAAQSVRKLTGRQVPVIYTVHGFHFFSGAPLKNWLYYPVERRMAHYTDRLITVNTEDYKRASRFPVRGSAEHISGVGLDLGRFKNVQKQTWEIERDSRDADDIRTHYGIPDDAQILVTVGELAPGKKHIAVIEAMAELGDLNLAYLICGTGDQEQVLRKRVQELHLEKRVFFAGYVEQIPALLRQCDCFIFPSAREGLPVALMEAMAVGLPVICSDIRGNHDLIEHGKGGYLVRGFDPVDYAVKIRRMFTEKSGKTAVLRVERRSQMGACNRQNILHFSREVVDRQMRKIYGSLLDTPDEKNIRQSV